MKLRILITGSAGFLGAATYNYFKQSGHDVVGVDLIDSATTDYVTDIREFIKSHNEHYDTVFHFAAIVGGRLAIETNFSFPK